ncbi:MAG: M23 family metallopeptidase, partial [Candidatus Magasanikbacteria bacterium]|nr:M23 family metallopeptidase [Candidatus Magasanikbacteria bacterium]
GDYLEEELYVNLPVIGGTEKAAGLSAQVSLGEVSAAPTRDIVSFNQNLSGVSSPSILPGVELGGRREIIKYVVQSGDSIPSIATRFQISLETIYTENKLTSRSIIRPGDVLTVLPISGVTHKVKKGDTWAKIAATYKADSQKIIDFNLLGEGELPVGETIIIPEGRAPVVVVSRPASTKPAQTTIGRPSAIRGAGEGMLWPTTARRISQYFGWRHTGIDIALPLGTPIYAADDGVVEKSGWNTGGYGYMILINHGNGIKTRYGHNSKLYVSVGEQVSKGDTISLMGSTGRSTGSHLHFEVIVNGVVVNPFLYVR